jgi:hypothetical protein
LKSRLVILLFTVVSFYIICNTSKDWQWWVFKWDKSGYHLYLPAFFIYKDIKELKFYKYIDEAYMPTGDLKEYELNKLPNGNKANKYSIGVAVRELPFFVAAHFVNKYYINRNTVIYPQDGYSVPYQWGAVISNLFWIVLGLVILRKFLRRNFNDTVTAITLLAIACGTNLYHYAVFTHGMAHGYLFFDFALVMYATDRLYGTGNKKYLYLLGLALGCIAITRISDLVVMLIPLLWGLNTIPAVKQRLSFLRQSIPHIAGALLLFFCVLMIQLYYWKYVTGAWIYNGYTDEGFVWTDPAIWQGLFSFRKGWFIYTPLAVFMLWGIYSMRRRFGQLMPAMLMFTVVNIYVIFSWWNWWYGGSFGGRALIESFAVLSLPFAAFTEQVLLHRSAVIKFASGILLVLLVALNMFQSYQAYKVVIHWDGMTQAYYFRAFFKTKESEEDKQYLMTDGEKYDENKKRLDKIK